MFANYTSELYKKLINQDFKPLIINNDEKLTDDTIYVCLLNYSSDIIYIVNILNTIKYKPDECMGKAFLTKSAILEKYNTYDIIFLNIFITNDNTDIKSYIDKIDKNLLSSFKDIFWGVDISKTPAEIYTDKLQPNKLLGIENHIKSIKASNVQTKSSLEDITKSALVEDQLRPKPSIIQVYNILILINTLVFILVLVDGGFTSKNLLNYGAYSYSHIVQGKEYYRLFTCMFLHANFTHFFANMTTLYIFGSRLEAFTNHVVFLAVYLFSGILANILMLLTPTSGIMLGASGCIFGIIGASLILSYHYKKSLFGLNYSSIIVIAMINLVSSFYNPQISFAVHLYGFLFGIIFGYVYIYDLNSAKNN